MQNPSTFLNRTVLNTNNKLVEYNMCNISEPQIKFSF